MSWSMGRVLMTRETRKWSKEEIDKMNKSENITVFSDFHPGNQGKTRQRVCTMNPDHPEYEQNKKIILSAQMNYVIVGMHREMTFWEKVKYIFYET